MVSFEGLVWAMSSWKHLWWQVPRWWPVGRNFAVCHKEADVARVVEGAREDARLLGTG
jgi:hypothetical protein